MIETRVHNKKTKLTTLWTYNIPKRHKWNTIKAELYRAKRISLNFTIEVTLIRNKFKSAGYPMRFVNSVVKLKQMRTMNSSFHLDFLKLRRK